MQCTKVQRILSQAGWFLRPDCAPVPNVPALRSPHTAAPPVQSEYPAERRAAAAVPHCCSSSANAGFAIGAKFKMYLLRHFCSNWVEFFYNTQETQTQKTMDQNSEIRILWFLKFSKSHHAVPLQPIWTIMVVTKLDQSRVLVTKFRQNRLTLKDRSASQRHTDRQTHRQTPVKIMAIQVCNRAKTN